jgi:uncharacterized RDD family membrane protein YckC
VSSGATAAVRPSTIDRAADAPYAGLVTRALAFAIDAAIIDVAALFVVAVVALASTVLYIPDDLKTVRLAIGAGAYVVWGTGYFVSFWATDGRTLGNRVMYIRVAPAGAGKLGYRRAMLRFVGLVLAVLPLLLGLVPILFNDRRRGLQDAIADTVVVHDPDRRAPRPGARQAHGPRQLR